VLEPSAAVVDLVDRVDRLVADEGVVTRPVQLLADAEVLLEQFARLTTVVVRRLADASAVDATSELFGRSLGSWLAEDLMLPGYDVARLKRLVRWLPSFPQTMAELAAGRINAGHADAIVKALTTLPAELHETLEPLLLAQAHEDTPSGVAEVVDSLLEALGYEKASNVRRERRMAERGIDLATTMDGMRTISGNLTADVAAKLETALARAAQKCGPEDDRTTRQRMHDAIAEIADVYLAQCDQPRFGGAPTTVVVTIPLHVLEQRLAEQWVNLPTGRITADAARRMACDANVVPVVLGTRGEVLDIGRASRDFTEAMRRAAWIEQQGRCAFPGCRRRCVELHHIEWWSRGGPTSLDNAAWLCAYHHWLVHEGGWTLCRGPDRSFVFTGPTGNERSRHPNAA
jgi:hypothetical protein